MLFFLNVDFVLIIIIMPKILSTSPPNDELLFTNESQISIVKTLQSKHIHCVDNKIDQISSSLQSISLEEKFTRTIPGLEKVYEALFEVVVYPLLYPDLIQKLKIVCPKGLYKIFFQYVYLGFICI